MHQPVIFCPCCAMPQEMLVQELHEPCASISVDSTAHVKQQCHGLLCTCKATMPWPALQ